MGLLGCDSDSLSKPAGRGPDEKRDRTEESRGGVGERKPGPSYTTPTLRHSASAKTPNVIKMEVVFGLFTAPRLSACLWGLHCFSDSFTAKIMTGVKKTACRNLD